MCRATSPSQPNSSSSSSVSKTALWFIGNKAYDLEKFADRHPGGLRNILLGRGRDATELFYSVHSTGNIGNALAVLEKYRCKEMDNEAPEQQFTFENDDMYQDMLRDVNGYFAGKKMSCKSPRGFWAKCTVQFILHSLMWFLWFYSGSYLAAAAAAILSITIGFAVFHTASHSGLSHDWRVNDFWTWLWGDVVLGFFRPLWLVHHVWGHHSYTGVDRLDPDIANGKPFARKSHDTAWKPWFKYQWFSIYIVFLVAPGQWFGQVIQYTRSMARLSAGLPGRIFGIQLKPYEAALSETRIFSIASIISLLGLWYLHGFTFALTSLAVHSFWRGFMYWAIVFPNHETESSCHTLRAKDWGEQQIRHSSNFWMPLWMSSATGGMNYQIEHHLFPAVHPDHYPALSEIVKAHCKKRNIPYNYYPSWFNALASNIRINSNLAMNGQKMHLH